MKKADFNHKVDTLLQKVENIPFDDYYGAMAVVREFEQFAHANAKYIDMFTTEHLGSIKADFKNMKKYKSSKNKRSYFQSGISGLRSDIKSMKANSVPE